MLLLILLVSFLLITQCLPTTCFLFDPSGPWWHVEEHLDTPRRPAVCSTWCSLCGRLDARRTAETDRQTSTRPTSAIARRNLSIVESSESQRDSDSSSVMKRRRRGESVPPSSCLPAVTQPSLPFSSLPLSRKRDEKLSRAADCGCDY